MSGRDEQFGKRINTVYLLVLGLTVGWFLLGWPIIAGDTDLWYHLSAGRYIFQHHAIPSTSFFSFLEPPRTYVDYYWLFQALVYGAYRLIGEHAFLLIRAFFMLSSYGVIIALLFRAGKKSHPPLVLAFFAGLYLALLMQRGTAVRPHLVTYLMIPLFLWILECKPRRTAWLIPLGVLWMNAHGIVYPILVGILSAYALEAGVSLLRGKTKIRDTRFMLPVLATLGTVFATPHGLKLLAVPWESTALESRYIDELKPVTFQMFGEWKITDLVPSTETLNALLLGLLFLAAAQALFQRPRRLSHLILFSMGAVLVPRGIRFLTEFALLSLPLLARSPLLQLLGYGTSQWKRFGRGLAILIGCLLGFVLTFILSLTLYPVSRYPVARHRLPEGVTAFLQEVGPGGNLINHPDSGGYYQWRLWPRYKIFMDMQVPFFFNHEDLYTAANCFSNADILKAMLARYPSAFVAVPMAFLENFKQVRQQIPELKLVFFDEQEALFANEPLQPGIVRAWQLSALDPHRMLKNIEKLDEFLGTADPAPAMRESLKVLTVDPGGLLPNALVSHVYLKEGAFDRALPFADNIIRSYPNIVRGYLMRGQALIGLRAFAEAEAALKAAVDRVGKPSETAAAYLNLGWAQLGLGKYKQAYGTLSQAVDVYAAGTPFEDIYALGIAARRIGHEDEARTYLEFARVKQPKDTQALAAAQRRLRLISVTIE